MCFRLDNRIYTISCIVARKAFYVEHYGDLFFIASHVIQIKHYENMSNILVTDSNKHYNINILVTDSTEHYNVNIQ